MPFPSPFLAGIHQLPPPPNHWSLTPGRYVGVAPAEVDDDFDFDFEQTLGGIHIEIADLDQEAAELAKRIQKNFEGLGV